MKRGFAVVIIVPLLFAAGCGQTKQVKVTYRSDPPGGVLYRLPATPDGEPDPDRDRLGECPTALWYNLDKDAIANGYLDARGLMVRWPSGPELRSDDLIRIKIDGTDRQVTFFQAAGEPRAIAPLVQGDEDQ